MQLRSRFSPRFATAVLFGIALGMVSCADNSRGAPTEPLVAGTPGSALVRGVDHYSLDVVLGQGPYAGARGHIRFRQPVDAELKILLDTWVWRMAPGTYSVQRAADTVLDGVCVETGWLTLGTITADENGEGFAALTRTLGNSSEGMTFDIHFRVLDAGGATVLNSPCYQYTARR